MIALMIALASGPAQSEPQPTLFDGLICASVAENVASMFRERAAGPNRSAEASNLVEFATGLAQAADTWSTSHVQRNPPSDGELAAINERGARRGAEIEAGGGAALLAELERCKALFLRT